MRKEIVLNGNDIITETNFHEEISKMLSFPSYNDNTLDSLLDSLTTYVDPNLTIHWNAHLISKSNMGHSFDQIIEVFDMVTRYHPQFTYHLN